MSTNTILRKNNRITIPHEIVAELHLATDLYGNFVFEDSEEEYDWGLPQGAEIW